MGMGAILFNGLHASDKIVNISLSLSNLFKKFLRWRRLEILQFDIYT